MTAAADVLEEDEKAERDENPFEEVIAAAIQEELIEAGITIDAPMHGVERSEVAVDVHMAETDGDECGGKEQPAETGKVLGKFDVGNCAENPGQSHGMSGEHDQHQEQADDPVDRTTTPDQSQDKQAETDGEVVVEEAHLERPAVGQHGDYGSQRPG